MADLCMHDCQPIACPVLWPPSHHSAIGTHAENTTLSSVFLRSMRAAASAASIASRILACAALNATARPLGAESILAPNGANA